MSARELEGAIYETTLDVARIRSLAEMAYEADGDCEQVATVLHLVIELAERANRRFCELAVQAGKMEQSAAPAPAKVDKRRGVK